MLYKDVMKKQGERTRRKLLACAVSLCEQANFWNLSRKGLAEAYGCAENLVSHHLGGFEDMRRAVFEEAVRTKAHAVIVQAAVGGYPAAKELDQELLKESFEKVTKCLTQP